MEHLWEDAVNFDIEPKYLFAWMFSNIRYPNHLKITLIDVLSKKSFKIFRKKHSAIHSALHIVTCTANGIC